MQHNENTEFADKLLRDAGYDPDLIRNRLSKTEAMAKANRRNRAQWQARNRLKDVDQRQTGLVAPRIKTQQAQPTSGLSFLVGFFCGKML